MLYNLKEYHRPDDVEVAYKLLKRKNIKTAALAGGSHLIGSGHSDIESVVDLRDLGLDQINRDRRMLHLGATVHLQTLVEECGDEFDGLLAETARRMAGLHIRNTSTIGGALASGDTHSPLSAALAALRARVKLYIQPGEMNLWSDMAQRARLNGLSNELVTTISIKLNKGMGAGYQQVGRTPADFPIVCVASVAYPTRDNQIDTYTAICGLFRDLILIGHRIFNDDHDTALEKVAAQIVQSNAPTASYWNDHLGSADYRRSIAPVLVRRALGEALSRMRRPAE